jgi:hypothetical protein
MAKIYWPPSGAVGREGIARRADCLSRVADTKLSPAAAVEGQWFSGAPFRLSAELRPRLGAASVEMRSFLGTKRAALLSKPGDRVVAQ